MVCQGSVGAGRNINAGTGRYIIKDQRLGGSVRNGSKHLDKTVLGSLIIIGSDHQHTVIAQFTCALGQIHSVCGVIGTGTGNSRNTAIDHLDRLFKQFTMLLIGQSGAFTGGTCNNQGINTLVDLPINQFFQLNIVNTVFIQGGNQRRSCTTENRIIGHNYLSFWDISRRHQVIDRHRNTFVFEIWVIVSPLAAEINNFSTHCHGFYAFLCSRAGIRQAALYNSPVTWEESNF